MRLPIYHVDAFASRVFSGNPAAVVPLERSLDDDTLQAIAEENNLSETAFIRLLNGNWEIRWFTPACEVDLCGHATLASAHCTLIPYWSARLGKKKLMARQISARGGELICELRGDRVGIAGRCVPFLEGTITL